MAIWRRLRDDFRAFPATMTLGTLWVLVFLLMVAHQATRPGGLTLGRLNIGLPNGHWFGDLKLSELFEGEVWRTLTATFVHYGLLHIGMNLYALYQLGGLVESWYGAGPFLVIYVLTGAGGNLLSGLFRQWLRSNPMVSSGGGSTVIMGLVALCAVVGWRSQTRIGVHLRNQMIWVILLTAGIGAGFSAAGLPVIDNWGHAGGALVGALIGLGNRGLLRVSGGRLARLSGWVAGGLIAASGVALLADDRAERTQGRQMAEQAFQRFMKDQRLIADLEKLRKTYRAVAYPRALRRGMYSAAPSPRRVESVASKESPKTTAPLVRPADHASGSADPAPRGDTPSGAFRLDPGLEFDVNVLNAGLRFIDALGGDLDNGESSVDYQQARRLLFQTLVEPPTLDEVREFDDRIASLLLQLRRDAARSQAVALGGRLRSGAVGRAP